MIKSSFVNCNLTNSDLGDFEFLLLVMLEEQMDADRCEIEECDEPESNLHN